MRRDEFMGGRRGVVARKLLRRWVRLQIEQRMARQNVLRRVRHILPAVAVEVSPAIVGQTDRGSGPELVAWGTGRETQVKVEMGCGLPIPKKGQAAFGCDGARRGYQEVPVADRGDATRNAITVDFHVIAEGETVGVTDEEAFAFDGNIIPVPTLKERAVGRGTVPKPWGREEGMKMGSRGALVGAEIRRFLALAGRVCPTKPMSEIGPHLTEIAGQGRTAGTSTKGWRHGDIVQKGTLAAG